MALLLSAVLMLRHIGEGAIADRIMEALGDACSSEGTIRTRDLGGTAEHDRVHRRDLPAGCSLPSRLPPTVLSTCSCYSRACRCLTKSRAPCSPATRLRDTSRAATAKAVARRASGSRRISRSCGPRSATRSTARSSIRSIRSSATSSASARTSRRPRRRRAAGRVVYASNHRSHTDYLVEPLVLDDNGIRPPIIAAGINLFGGPLGLIHRHVTGAMPIRRNTRDPAYLMTLKAYVAELLRKHDLFFYPGGRPQLQRRDQACRRPG